MAQASEKRTRKARRAAAATVLCVVLFSGLFVGSIALLGGLASNASPEDDLVTASGVAQSEPFYVLLIGSDSRKGTALYTGRANDQSQVDQYADIITLMRVEPVTYDLTLVTIPRDTVMEGESEKVNASLLSNDPNDVVDAVERLTGVHISYYMMTTFISFENLINALGGIDVDVPRTVTVSDPSTGKNVTVKAGKNQHLDGSQALVLARARKDYGDDQEALRQVNVRNIERAIIKKVLAYDGDFDVEHVLAALEHDTYTDIDLPSIGLTMIDFVEHADEVSIYDCTGPYKGTERASDGQWVVDGDEETWIQLMQLVDTGQDPSTFIKAPTFKS